jgi:hypothetical protein
VTVTVTVICDCDLICAVPIQFHLPTNLKSLSKSHSRSLMVRCLILCGMCLYLWSEKTKIWTRLQNGKRTVETIHFRLFPSCWISLNLFPFLTENCMGFGLEMAGNSCSPCRGFQFFDPKLLCCGGAASEEKNS